MLNRPDNRFGRCLAHDQSQTRVATHSDMCLSGIRLLDYGDCEDPAKMTDTKMDFVSRHQAPSLRMQL